MHLKKNPKANLETYSKIFLQLGLVFTLFMSLILLEYQSASKTPTISSDFALNADELIDVPIIIRKEKVMPPPPKPATIIDKIDNEDPQQEDLLKSSEIEPDEKVTLSQIIEIPTEEDVPDDIPFPLIKNAPIFPGCENLSKPDQKKCLSKQISKLVNKKFNSDLASELGLTSGKKRIFVMFKIDRFGNVVNIRARAPLKRLEKEAIRVVKLIPKMIPGNFAGHPVGVNYSLPIIFNVQN